MIRIHFTPRATAVVLALVSTLFLGACAQTEDKPGDITFGHVHGLGVNPADNRLFVATHDGLFVVDDSRPWRVGHSGDDLMGFTVVGPDEFLASGHPMSADLPSPMGLVRTDDFGMTWQPVSLGGQADLHAIDVSGDRVVAYDSMTETIVSSIDSGATFGTLAEFPAIDIALNSGGSVLASGLDGSLWLFSKSGTPQLMTDAPQLTYLDSADETVGLGPDGSVWVSADGRDWSRRGDLPGQPQAVTVEDGGWFAATTTGVYKSIDAGVTWESVL